jgi:hypothetical protein
LLCSMLMPSVSLPTELRTNWMPCNGWCSNIQHTVQTNLWPIEESPQIYITRWSAEGCDTVTLAATQGIVWIRDMLSCQNSWGCLYGCSSTLILEHPGPVLTCLCLIHHILQLENGTETHQIIICTYVTGYQVNSGEFLHRKRFYIASSPQDTDNKGSVSSCCVKTVLITVFSGP